jgi:hypothetical protein
MLDEQRHGCPGMGLIVLQMRQKTSLSCALLLDNCPSYHCCSHILFELILLAAESLP